MICKTDRVGIETEKVLYPTALPAQGRVEESGVGDDVETEQHQRSLLARCGENHKGTLVCPASPSSTKGSCIIFSPGDDSFQDGAMKFDAPKNGNYRPRRQHTQIQTTWPAGREWLEGERRIGPSNRTGPHRQ